MATSVDFMMKLLAVSAAQRKTLRTPADFEPLVEAGLSSQALTRLREATALPVSRLVPVLGVSERSFSNLARRPRLDALTSDRLLRIALTAGRAAEVFGSQEKATEWLKTPLAALAGKTPFDKLATETGAARVEEILLAIEHGVYV